MECPYCKAENRDGVRYCSNCGRLIDPAALGSGVSSNSLTVASTPAKGITPGGSGGSHTLSVGTTLQGGRYVVKKILGQGGMGAALLATDKRVNNKQVVIKELVSESSDPDKIKEDERNFKQEMMTLAALHHPLIPAVTDSFDENLRYFMVQDYVEGENLEERMESVKQPMKEREALGYASQVLDVLEYLARRTPPIVHRDIKPANIIIDTEDKRAHLVDFGIARADVIKNARRKQTSALGTPGYAPPEQYQGNADPRSDLYALGATLHHLLTNRDPRDYPPFSYPPARTLNPQLTPEVEQLLAKATNNDITQRYQSAIAMKRDVDTILLKRHGVSGAMDSYTLGTSGPIPAVSSTGAYGYGAANQPTQVSQPPRRPAPITPLPPVAGQQSYQPGLYAPPAPRRRSNVGLNFFLLILVVVLLFAFGFGAYYYFQHRGTTTAGGNTPTPVATSNIPASGIGVIKASNGEMIGISNGIFPFDTGRPGGNFMTQAAQSFQSGNMSSAESLWNQAAQADTANAEALIYLENQTVLDSGSPYIDIAVATMLTGDRATVSVGRDDLQGAYVAQKNYNDGHLLPNGVQVRLLIANSGSQTTFATPVAQEIVNLQKSDSHFVGVMGWPFSSRVVQVLSTLAPAQIPMVSQTASGDSLTGKPYFFRVAPPNVTQGVIGAHFAETNLHATRVALFVDNSDPYSQTLAQAFSNQFTKDGGAIVKTEAYTVGKPDNFVQLLANAETANPNLIYFSGYAADASVLLTDLPVSGPFANLQVMGGDALYELGGYQSSSHAAGVRMHFTTFAHPDEWPTLCAAGKSFACSQPNFFGNYKAAFDPNNQHGTGTYGYSRADGDVILSYDAISVMLTAAQNMLTGSKTSLTPAELLQGLKKISGAQAFQGVSGQISFNSQGNPVNKALVVLKVAPGGFIQIDSVQGCFQVGETGC
ncbi:MAG: protein kinase domain-containing protein [Ktedonobacteraceae bacterium]